MCIDFRLKKMMIVEIVILVISDEKSLSFRERLYKKSPNWNLSLCKAGINPYNYFNLEVLTQLSVFCNFSILECQCKSAFSIFIKAKNVKLRKNQFRYSQFYLPQYLEKHCHVLPGAWSGQTPL